MNIITWTSKSGQPLVVANSANEAAQNLYADHLALVAAGCVDAEDVALQNPKDFSLVSEFRDAYADGAPAQLDDLLKVGRVYILRC